MAQNSNETFQGNSEHIESNETDNEKFIRLLNVDVLHRGSVERMIELSRSHPTLLEPRIPEQKEKLDVDNKLLKEKQEQVMQFIEGLFGVAELSEGQRQEALLSLGRYSYQYNKYHIKWARPDRTIDMPSSISALVTKDLLQSAFNKEIYKKYHGLEKAMSINEDMIPDWENAVSNLLLEPEMVVRKTALQKAEWDKEFDAIITKRGKVAGLLKEVIEISKNGEKVDEEAGEEFFRELAGYLNSLNQYHIRWKADYRYVELPEFLADKVELDDRRNTAIATTAKILSYQHHLTEGDDRADRLAPVANNILIRMVGKNLRLKYCVLPCLQEDGKPKKEEQAYISVLEDIGYETSIENIKALKLIVTYVSEHITSIDAFAENKGFTNRGEVRLYQALEQSSFLPGVQDTTDGLSRVIAEKSTEFIKDGKIIKLTPGQAPDLSDITIDFNIDSIPPALREQIDNEILMEVAQIKEFQNLSESELRSHLDRVLEYLYDKEHSVPLRNRKVNYDELGEIEKAIVEVMVRKVANDDTVSSLRSSLFIDADTSDNWQQKAIKAFEDLLDPEKGSLKNKDIASMYYLLRLSQESASKPGPNLMLAMKSLSLLRQNPDNRKVVINLESQLFNRVVSLFIDTATDAEGLTEAMEKMKIPPEHQTTVSNVGETIRLKTADAVQEAIDRSMAEARNFPIFWIAGIIAGTAAVGVPVGVQIRRVTYQLNAGRLHRFYTDAISSTEDLTKFRRVFNLDNSITIEQIRSARIAAKDIYSEITDLQSRFAILERGRLNKRGKSLLSSMKKSEFERYGKQIRKQFPKSPEKVARILSSFEADPAKLQEILLKSGYSAEQVQQGIGPLLVEALKSDRATELMKQFDDLYTELDEIEKIPEAAKRRAARDAFRQKVEKYMGELDGFKKVGDTGMLRRQISQKLLSRLTGNTIEISDDLWEVIEKAHKMDSIPEKVSALKKALSQVDGLDEAQRTSAMRRFVRLGITGEAPSAVLRMPVKTIEQARLMFDLLDPDQVVRFLRELPRKLPSFRPEAFTELIGRAKEAFTSTPSVAADITRLERASGLATDSLKLGKVYKGGKLVGRSLLVFGILLEGYFMNITYQEIKQADKQGNENEKRILRSKLYTQGADAGVGVVGVPVAFAFSGPAGWLALGGLVTKNYTSDYLYDYAIDANRVELQQFRQKQPSELVAIMEGERDWLVENQASKEYRRDTALHAYIYNNRIVDFTSEDEAYLQHTCNDSEEFDKQRMIIFEDKIGHFYNDMLSFLQENKEQLSKYPFSEQLELAQSFAELRHLRRRAKQLENPEILESELQNLRGANPYLGTDLSLGPPARASNEVISYLEAHQQNKLQALYYPYLMQMTLEKRDKQSKRDRVNFVVKLSETLLQHDEAEYLSDVAGESDNWPEHRRIDTFVKIMDYEVNQMFKRPMSFDQFVTKIQKLKNELREFMQDGKTLDPNEQRSSYFGEYKLDWRKKGKNRD